MRTIHVTIMIFLQIILASFIIYSTTVTAAPSTATDESSQEQQQQQYNSAAAAVAALPSVEKLSLLASDDKLAKVQPQQDQEVEKRSAVVVIDSQQAQVPQAKLPSSNSVDYQNDAGSAAAALLQYPIVLQSEPAKVELADSPVHILKASDKQPMAKFLEMATIRATPVAPNESLASKQSVTVAAVGGGAVNKQAAKYEMSPAAQAALYQPDEEESKILSASVSVVVANSSPTDSQLAPRAHSADKLQVEQPALERQLASGLPIFAEQLKPKAAPLVAEQPPQAPALVAQAPLQVPVSRSAPTSVHAAPAAPVAGSPSILPKNQIASAVVVQQPSANVATSQSAPVVNGGLGPLHLLAATLCGYQPDKPVADETLNLLYQQRASLRKSLFDFMSLKFTNLEKLSSRLHPGLEVMPPKKADATSLSGVVGPSHGWPVVGKCTAHDLKLMAEAAWCECAEGSTNCGGPKTSPSSIMQQQQQREQQQQVAVQASELLDKQEPKILSNRHQQRARSVPMEEQVQQQQQLPEQYMPVPPAVISKLMRINDVKEAPVVEGSIANLNLTQQQLAMIQVQASSTRECRRNALRLTKALFNHLAEDQKNVSESWPKLYSQMTEDDCARKRMIDVVTALSGFRGESTSIRRDNVEFAFAMDDLRSKVLDSEVNVPLTFDKQFIEVEQFLQQSVKLMLANIDPERARLTSMRYRSLMPGPMSADDQCIELHQRLMAKNYPTDCNPTQFGQLPDVLRMAANSLELWSIESEINKFSSKMAHDYPSSSSVASPAQQVVNGCIANLVAS